MKPASPPAPASPALPDLIASLDRLSCSSPSTNSTKCTPLASSASSPPFQATIAEALTQAEVTLASPATPPQSIISFLLFLFRDILPRLLDSHDTAGPEHDRQERHEADLCGFPETVQVLEHFLKPGQAGTSPPNLPSWCLFVALSEAFSSPPSRPISTSTIDS